MNTYLGNEAPLPGTDAKPHPVDVVFHLGRTRRFGGWANPEWTVLHHSMLVSMLYMRSFGTAGVQDALLHDAHEYVTGDIPTPVKNLLGKKEVKALEEHLDTAIKDSLCISLVPDSITDRLVKFCDTAALIVEAFHFGDKAGSFSAIGKTCWASLRVEDKQVIAGVVASSCPEVYKAMVSSEDYNHPNQMRSNLSWILP